MTWTFWLIVNEDLWHNNHIGTIHEDLWHSNHSGYFINWTVRWGHISHH